MATGSTRCSGSQADSKPSRSAASAASTHKRGCMRPKVTANFTRIPPARRPSYRAPLRRTPCGFRWAKNGAMATFPHTPMPEHGLPRDEVMQRLSP